MAALSISAYPQFGWLARYQAYYGIFFILFVLFGLVWGLLPGAKRPPEPVPAPRLITIKLPDKVVEATNRAEATALGRKEDSTRKPSEPRELPWTEGDQGWGNLGQSVNAGPRPEVLDASRQQLESRRVSLRSPAEQLEHAPEAKVEGEERTDPADDHRA